MSEARAQDRSKKGKYVVASRVFHGKGVITILSVLPSRGEDSGLWLMSFRARSHHRSASWQDKYGPACISTSVPGQSVGVPPTFSHFRVCSLSATRPGQHDEESASIGQRPDMAVWGCAFPSRLHEVSPLQGSALIRLYQLNPSVREASMSEALCPLSPSSKTPP